MSLQGSYTGVEAQLRSFAKDQLVIEGPKALAPGAPVIVTTQAEDGSAISIDARTVGSKRICTEPVVFEIRMRVINANRELRQWLEANLGHEANK